MQKRQTILLIVMGLALVYAAFTFLTGGTKDTAQQTTPKDFKELLEGVHAASIKASLDAVEQRRIDILSGEATSDPLLKRRGDKNEDKVATRTGDNRFVYNGFISLSGRKMALINDSEYSLGDLVDESGYTLIAIDDASVILKGRNPQTGQEDKVAIPIKEDIITFVEDKNAQ